MRIEFPHTLSDYRLPQVTRVRNESQIGDEFTLEDVRHALHEIEHYVGVRHAPAAETHEARLRVVEDVLVDGAISVHPSAPPNVLVIGAGGAVLFTTQAESANQFVVHDPIEGRNVMHYDGDQKILTLDPTYGVVINTLMMPSGGVVTINGQQVVQGRLASVTATPAPITAMAKDGGVGFETEEAFNGAIAWLNDVKTTVDEMKQRLAAHGLIDGGAES